MPYADILIPPLIGTWINCAFYLLEIRQSWNFYTSKRVLSPGGKSTFICWLVALVLFVDTAGTIGACAYAFLLSVTHWGDPDYFLKNDWPASVYTLSTGLSGFILQVYLIWRYWAMTRHWHLTVIFGLGSLTGLVGACMTTTFAQAYSALEDRPKIVPAVTLWISAAAGTDVAVALALALKLRSTKSKTQFKQTQKILRRLIYSAIQTGAGTSILAMTVLILYIRIPSDNISLAIGFFLGRAYGCTLLFNLNSGRMGEIVESTEKSAELSESGANRATRLDTFGGIHIDVHHTTFRQVEDGVSAEVGPDDESLKGMGLVSDKTTTVHFNQ